MMDKLNGCIFLIEDGGLLEKYNTIRAKVSGNIKKVFESDPVYNKSFLKTKIKSQGDEVTGFYGKKIPKVDPNHTCLAVINLDSPFKKDHNYYPQVFLKEQKYIEKKVIHINDKIKFIYKSIATYSDKI